MQAKNVPTCHREIGVFDLEVARMASCSSWDTMPFWTDQQFCSDLSCAKNRKDDQSVCGRAVVVQTTMSEVRQAVRKHFMLDKLVGDACMYGA